MQLIVYQSEGKGQKGDRELHETARAFTEELWNSGFTLGEGGEIWRIGNIMLFAKVS